MITPALGSALSLTTPAQSQTRSDRAVSSSTSGAAPQFDEEMGIAPTMSLTAPTPGGSPLVHLGKHSHQASGSLDTTTRSASPMMFAMQTGTRPPYTADPLSSGDSPRGVKRRAEDQAEDDPSNGGTPNCMILLLRFCDLTLRTSCQQVTTAPTSFKHIRMSPSVEARELQRSHSQSTRSAASPPPSPKPGSRPGSVQSMRSTMHSPTPIPFRAIISPRPPSVVSTHSNGYHMRDPSRPPSVMSTKEWAGSARMTDETGRRIFPLQGWAFILGLIVFPAWWVAALMPHRWVGKCKDNRMGKGCHTVRRMYWLAMIGKIKVSRMYPSFVI